MVKEGFTRVLITERNKTTRIRTALANNPDYMSRNGLVKIDEPVMPPKPVTPMAPASFVPDEDRTAYLEFLAMRDARVHPLDDPLIQGQTDMKTTIQDAKTVTKTAKR